MRHSMILGFLALSMLISFPAFGMSREKNREQLQESNIPYTSEEFLKRAAEGDTEIVNLFLDSGMDPDVRNEEGATALILAAQNGHAETVKALLAKGADVNAENKEGDTALDLSRELEIIKALILKRGPLTPQQWYDKAMKELAKAKNEEERFYALDQAAKESFNAGKVEEARAYAQELMGMLPKFQGDWNYGNAVQDANVVFGRIAVLEGRIGDAKRFLIAAGKSPGSPQMDSFGPNMSLAKDLLEKGERDVALEYFDLCRKFWKMDYGKLDEWAEDVKAGKIPSFGPNLLY